MWTFINTTETDKTKKMKDSSVAEIEATLYGATFIKPPRLPSAVSLRGHHKWIGIDSGMIYIYL